jgi:hypothetical protein
MRTTTRFEAVRAASIAEIPPADPAVLDVALLDMNYGFLNLGHDAIVSIVAQAADALSAELEAAGKGVRVISLPVRNKFVVPPAERFSLYLGTGGPGHIDPHRNVAETEATIVEDPAWEAPLFALFDAIRADESRAMIAVCHTFGILCRWSGVAEPALRKAASGGGSLGLRTTVLLEVACSHPWFAEMIEHLSDSRYFPVIDSRFYDLVPTGNVPEGMTLLAFEANEDGQPAAAVTIVEFARTADGRLPRMLGVNHHPEVSTRSVVQAALDRKLAAGEIDDAWYASRAKLFGELARPDHDEAARLVGCEYTFSLLLRRHLERLL